LHVVIDPGLGADCLAGIAQPFDDALGAVRAQGYAAELLPLGNLAGSAENAGRLRQTILALPEDGRPLIVIGYSRGATDGLEALATMPEVRARVVAFVAMAGTVNGSPLADHVLPAAANLLRFLPGATCELGDGRGVAELRPSFRLTRRMALPPIPDLPLYSLVTFVDRAQVSPLLRPTWDVLARVDSRNDGQILAWDQILPGSALLGFLRADHLAAIAPVGPQLPWYVRGLLQGEDFPRAAVLEAVLRIVEEDLLARPGGKNASPPPAPAS
jgi:pimeloyl-ACP methyl ester carboxylesterase